MVIQGNVAMQVTQPGGQPWNFGSDDQILIRFATNQKMHIWMKYKLDSKKYRKFDFEKYKNILNKILQWPDLELMKEAPSGDQIWN